MFYKKNDFIIESEPKRTEVNYDELKKVSEHINNGFQDGLTEKEIEILLDWTVENTRQNLEKHIEKYTGKKSIIENDLFGLCGFGQTSSLLPFENIFKVTYNSTLDFNTSKIEYVTKELRHAFGTVEFPLKTKNGVEKKQYLIDTTFRQFFKKIMCEITEYESDGTYVVDPGYFLCNKIRRTKESINLATQLLKKGYIELTDENLKLYIDSFMYSSIYRTNQFLLHDMKKLDINYYRSRLRKLKPGEQEYDAGKLITDKCTIAMPYIDYNVKTR